MFDWDDLKYLLAVATHGSTVGAARALRVDQSTVQRRLAALERGLGQALVERQPEGYRLTEFGQTLLPHARGVQDAVLALQRRVEQARHDVAGVVRVTCPEPMAGRLTHSDVLRRFHERYPKLRVEFVMSDRYLDLAKGEADVALRSGDTEDGVLLGRKIGDSLWALYASSEYVARHGAPRDVREMSQHALVGFEASMAQHRASAWLLAAAPEAHVAARHASVLGVLQAVKSGVGVAPLPTAIGDAEPDLMRAFGPIPELTRIWRILTPQQLRQTPRVAAFFDFMVGEVDALRPILTG